MTTWQEDIISGKEFHLPDNIRHKYQAYDGGQFSKLIIVYLEQLMDEVKELRRIVNDIRLMG